MKGPLGRGIAVVSMALVVTACGGGGEGSGGTAPGSAGLSTLCGPRFDLTAGRSCPGGLCESGVVFGSAADNAGPYSMGFASSDAMCTKKCSATADCQGISFATTNSVTVVAENWTCLTTSTGSFCAVSVTAPSGGGNSCSICGGAFCSGDCIGCPQCS